MLNSSFSIHVKDSLLCSLAAPGTEQNHPPLANTFPFSAEKTVIFNLNLTTETNLCTDHLSRFLIWLDCSDAHPSAVKTDNFLLQYKMLTAVEADLKITLPPFSPPLVLSSGRTFYLFFFFFFLQGLSMASESGACST